MVKNMGATFGLSISMLLMISVAGCQTADVREEITDTPAATVVELSTEIVEKQQVTPTGGEAVEPSATSTEAIEPRTLVICQGTEPENFQDGTFFSAHILEAIFDGPIDENSFGYQPVILEKLPNLADGDASITPVIVSEGDKIMDASGNVVELDAAEAIMLVPAGGGESVLYEGGEFEMDQLSATFHLLPGLQWSDGSNLSSYDSIYAFNMAADPELSTNPYIIERTESYEASNDLTITWTGLPGYVDSSYFLNFFDPMPEHLWGKLTPADLVTSDEWGYSPIGWGPYILDEWIHGDRIILRKNPHYFRADEGLPAFDSVVYRFVGPDSDANIAALISGECDILATLTGLDDEMERVIELHEEGKINATFTTGTVWSHIDFGIQHSDYDDGYQIGKDRPDFFSDVRTRRAFAMCMDRQAFVDELFYGQTLVIDTYLPPQHPYFNPEVEHYDFEIAAGSALLEEVGWMDHDNDPSTPRVAVNVEGVVDDTELIVSLGGVEVSLIAQAIPIFQKSLTKCGIQVETQFYTREEFYGELPEGIVFGRNFDLVLFAWGTGNNPPCELFLSGLTPGPSGETWISIQDGEERIFGPNASGGQNNPGFVDQSYDAACNLGLSTLPGQPEHISAHKEAQRIFSEQLPIVPLALVNKLAATRPDMCGFIMDPTANSEFWNIEEFDYGEGCED